MPSSNLMAALQALSPRIDGNKVATAWPQAWVEWLFARFALLVRRQTAGDEGAPDVSWRDFPVGPADARCLDLLALCRRPQPR